MWYYTVQNDQGGHPRWWLHSSNHKMVAHSGEAFDSTYNATRAAEHFKANAGLWDYEVYADSGGSYRWRAKANNGATVASSGESFYDRANAQRAADSVKANAGSATGP
jgi:uncharacterized protein YegP (UPF0339 family)